MAHTHEKECQTASGLIVSPAGRIVLIKHKRHGVWIQPGGHVEIGETLMEGFARELDEETGIDMTQLRLVDTSHPARPASKIHPKVDRIPIPFDINLHPVDDDQLHRDHIYVFEADEEYPIEPHPGESTDVGWFSYEDIEKLEDKVEIYPDIKQVALAAISLVKSLDR